MICEHVELVEYHEVMDTWETRQGRFRVWRVTCEDCNGEGYICEKWSSADAEWLYHDEEWPQVAEVKS